MQTMRILLGLIVCFLAPVIFAQESHCSVIEDNALRTDCYADSAHAKNKGWRVLKSKALQSITVSNSAVHEVKCGDEVGSLSLVFTCAEAKQTFVLSTSCQLGERGDTHNVQIQVDENSPRMEKFVSPNNKYALSMDDQGSIKRIAQSLFAGKSMHIRIFPSSRDAFTATFDLTEFEKSMQPLMKQCL